MMNTYYYVFAGVLGLVFGSFYGCTLQRFLTSSPLLSRHSYCPHCKKRLYFFHLIPVVSYFILRGKCAFCQVSISKFYLVIELLTCFSSLLLAYKFQLTSQFYVFFIAFGLILMASVIDYYTMTIPDFLSILPVFYLVLPAIYFDIFPFYSVVFSSLFAGGTAFLLYLFFKYVRKLDALGFGDVKYLFFLGSLLPLSLVPLMFILAASLGICVTILTYLRNRQQPIWNIAIPFAPCLSMATFIALMFR